MPRVSRVSFFAFPTKMSMPPFSAFYLWWEIIRSLSIGWHIYCTAYNTYTIRTIRTIPWITRKYSVAFFDIYFITLFFSTCQVRVKLVFVQSRLSSPFTRRFSRTRRVINPDAKHISSRPAFHSARRCKHRMFAAAMNVQVSPVFFASGRFTNSERWRKRSFPGIHSKGILLMANETDSVDKSWRAILFGQYIGRDRTRNTSRAIAPTCIPNAREWCGRWLQLWSLRADCYLSEKHRGVCASFFVKSDLLN